MKGLGKPRQQTPKGNFKKIAGQPPTQDAGVFNTAPGFSRGGFIQKVKKTSDIRSI